MIKILHGDNLAESRKALSQLIQEARAAGQEILNLESNKIDLSELRKALESNSLLGKNRFVILENFLSGRKSKDKSGIYDFLFKGRFENDLIFWEDKELKGVNLPSGIKAEKFRLNPVIFRFLENLKPGNSTQMLILLLEVKQTGDPQMIFYMLSRQIRLLILAKDLGANGLSSLSPWQQQKLLTQAKYFTLDQLQRFYKELLKVDFQQKTSGDSYSLASRLDLLVASL